MSPSPPAARTGPRVGCAVTHDTEAVELVDLLVADEEWVRREFDAIVAAGAESPYTEWLANWDPARDMSHRVTTRVDCAEWFPVRDAALIAHATQIDPLGRWFACPMDVQQRVWPTEDYELARSLVDTAKPEDDLFAGVRSEVGVR